MRNLFAAGPEDGLKASKAGSGRSPSDRRDGVELLSWRKKQGGGHKRQSAHYCVREGVRGGTPTPWARRITSAAAKLTLTDAAQRVAPARLATVSIRCAQRLGVSGRRGCRTLRQLRSTTGAKKHCADKSKTDHAPKFKLDDSMGGDPRSSDHPAGGQGGAGQDCGHHARHSGAAMIFPSKRVRSRRRQGR